MRLYDFDAWLSQDEAQEATEVLELRAAACAVLAEKNPWEKCRLLRHWRRVPVAQWSLDTARDWSHESKFVRDCPGIPARPELVGALDTPQRSMHTIEGRAMMVHALAHIEFNAINLALDAMVRFAGLSADYYWDWWQVAAEEAYHFSLIEAHLTTLGAQYGDYPAHRGLWDMAERTAHSLADRMAMVPRTLEARGLDACPVVQEKFRACGDSHAVAILDIILRDEIGHVALGHRWFVWACAQQQHEPMAHYRVLAKKHHAPALRPPVNIAARRAAGFFESELQAWQKQN